MEKEKTINDRRTVFTKNEIRKAYLALLDSKPPEKISVTELCGIAGINRGTFYLHYKDARAVWEELEDIVYEEATHTMSDIIRGGSTQCAKERYEAMRTNELWQKVYYGKYYSMRLYNKIAADAKEAGRELLLAAGNVTQRQAEIAATFINAACLAVEKDRQQNPWLNFEEDDAFYNELINGVYEAIRNRAAASFSSAAK